MCYFISSIHSFMSWDFFGYERLKFPFCFQCTGTYMFNKDSMEMSTCFSWWLPGLAMRRVEDTEVARFLSFICTLAEHIRVLWVYVCIFMFACVWGYMCVFSCVCVEFRGCSLLFSLITLHLIFWSWISHVHFQLSDSVSLAVRLALETPCLHFPDAGITGGLPHIQLFPGLWD